MAPGSKARDSGSGGERPTTIDGFDQLARRGNNSILRCVASLLVVLVVWGVFAVAISSVPEIIAAHDGDPDTYVNGRTLEVVGYPVADFVALMLGFLGIWLGLFIAVRYVHRRPFLTLVNASGRVNWRRLGQGFVLFLLLLVPTFAAGYLLDPQNYELVVDPGRLLVFVVAVLVLVPVQATAEELFSRGYLLQLFGLATSNVVVLSLISGILFALPHMPNPEAAGDDKWLYFADMLVFGFAMALVTIKDGGLELAVGAHVANNVFAMPLVNYDESFLDTPSVFWVQDATMRYPDLAISVAVVAVFYLLVFGIFERKVSTRPVEGVQPRGESNEVGSPNATNRVL